MTFSGAFVKPFRPAFDAGLAAAALAPVAGMAAWWKADALALANNDPVALWSDSSLNGHDVAQSTAGAKPTYQTGVLNEKPVVTFDGGDFLRAGDTGMPTGNMSILVVGRAANTYGSASYGTALHWGIAAVSKAIILTFGSDGNLGTNGYGVSQYGNAAGMANSCQQYYVFSVVRSSTTYNLWRNNSSNVSKTMASATETYGANGLSIGLYNESIAPAFYFVGGIAEILVYGSALSTADRNTTEQYLAAKYGLTLA